MKTSHIVLLSLLAATVAGAATLTVTSTADHGPGSLRQSLASASNGDTIDVSGISGTILLTSGELLITNNVTILGPGAGNLAVDGNHSNRVFHVGSNSIVTISSLTITNGSSASNFLWIMGAGILNEHGALTLSRCNLSGNSVGSAIYSDAGTLMLADCTLIGNNGGSGGAIVSTGTLTVSNCVFSSNWAGPGGAIETEGAATIIGSTFIGNGSVVGGGGAIYNSGTLTIADSLLTSNYVEYTDWIEFNGGGGLYNSGSALVRNCLVSGNLVYGASTPNPFLDHFVTIAGAGILNFGTITVSNSSITSNNFIGEDVIAEGGGVFNGGNLLAVGTTLFNNSFADVYNSDPFGPAMATLANCTLESSFVINDAWGHDATLTILNCTLKLGYMSNSGSLQLGSTILDTVTVIGSITSLGYNLSGNGGGGYLTNATDQIYTDPKLGPLQDNGGPTFTHALLLGSPAIDKGKNFSTSTTDQRGRPRTYDNPAIPNAAGGDGTDIGAFEFIPPILTVAPNFGNVVLSWITNDPGYTVESTSVLPNTGSWTTVPGTPLLIGGQYLLEDGPVTGNKFYRLRSP